MDSAIEIENYFSEYFEIHRDIITFDEVYEISRKRYGDRPLYDRTNRIARNVYLQKIILSVVEDVLKEAGLPLTWDEVVENNSELQKVGSGVRNMLPYYARSLETDIVAIVRKDGKNIYAYNSECAKAQREGRNKHKLFCYSDRCGTENCYKSGA